MTVNDVVPAVVTDVDAATIHAAGRRATVTIDKKGFAWTRQDGAGATRAPRRSRRGEAADARPAPRTTATGTLDQTAGRRRRGARDRQPHRADQGDGRRLQLRAQQVQPRDAGVRQVGSAFKPFVYTTAIDRGYTPATMLQDSPVTFPGGAGQPPYSPQNYDRKFGGPVTLRHALEQSRNVPAVKLMDPLGPKQVIAYARRFGLTSPLPPYLPIALGAGEETLIEMTSAYSVFPNQGVRMAPYSVLKVTDREGNLLEENRPEPQDAIRADTAYVMTSLLRGVVAARHRGQGGGAQLAGRRQDRHDRRLHATRGSSASIPTSRSASGSATTRRSRSGQGMTGAEAALPIWMDIMKAWIGDRKEPPELRAARQHRVRRRRQGLGRSGSPGHARRDHGSLHRRHPAGSVPQSLIETIA